MPARRSGRARRAGVRPARPRRLPAAVAERLLHGRRPHHRHRPAPEPEPRSRCRATSPATRSGPTSGTATTASARARRSRPRCPASTHRPRSSSTGAVPITDIERTYDPRPADRGDQRRHAPAPPDLVGAGRQPGRPGGRQPDHPARPSTSRRAARYIVALRNLQDARTARLIKAQQPFRVYRDRLPSDDPAVEARRPHMERHLHDARAGRHRAQRASTSPGTSRSPASATSPSARSRIRDDAFAQLGDTNLGRPAGAGHARRSSRSRTVTDYTRRARTTRSRARWRAPSSCRAT